MQPTALASVGVRGQYPATETKSPGGIWLRAAISPFVPPLAMSRDPHIEFSENGVRNALIDARKQLPKNRLNIDFVKVPPRQLHRRAR